MRRKYAGKPCCLAMTAAITIAPMAFGFQEVRVSAQAAIETAKQHSGGKVLSNEFDEMEDGTLVYRIKVLTQNGVVKTLFINAKDGSVIESPK